MKSHRDGLQIPEYRRSWHGAEGRARGAHCQEGNGGSNLRLVISRQEIHNRGLQFSISSRKANRAVKAVDKFEYRRGYKFSTYHVGIRQANPLDCDQARTIRFRCT